MSGVPAPAAGARPGIAPRIAAGLGRVLLFLALTLALAEGALRVASLVMRDRAMPWRAGAARRVLCVGDSHTYGAGVAADDAYPEQLQRLLDAQVPAVYSVANLGVPGMSTTQVRNRLPAQIARLRPDVVVVWCGVNDVWNRIDEDARPRGWRGTLDVLLANLRLTRLVRVSLQSREIEQDLAGHAFGDRLRVQLEPDGAAGGGTTIDWGQQVERLEVRALGRRTDAEAARVARADYEAIVAIGRARGVPVVFVSYPLGIDLFRLFNRAMKGVAQRRGVPLVDAVRSLERVPPEEQTWVYMAHPGPAIYREIARDVAAVVTELAPAPAR